MTRIESQSLAQEPRDPPLTAETLREIGLFGALGDATLEHLTKILKTLRVLPGDIVFREGDASAREMLILLEGEMEVSKRSRSGKDTRIAILGPNDWFGEMAMIDMQPRSATARSLAPCRLIRMTSENLDSLYRFDLKSYALIVLNIARDLSRRLRVTDRIMADFAGGALDEYMVARRPQG